MILVIPILFLLSSCNEGVDHRHSLQEQDNAKFEEVYHGSETHFQLVNEPYQNDKESQPPSVPTNQTEINSPNPEDNVSPNSEENNHTQDDQYKHDEQENNPDEFPIEQIDKEDADANPEPSDTEIDLSQPSEDADSLDNSIDNPQSDNSTTVIAFEADGLSNLYQVNKELYRSAQPEKGGLLSARDLGIKTILSLQLFSFDSVIEVSEQSGLRLEHVPMIPTTVSEDDIIKALKIIKNSEKPILVHCLHGSDRTGTVVAMYRIVFENWTKEEAKSEMTSEQFGYHSEFANLLELIDSIDVDAIRTQIMDDADISEQ